MAKEIFEAFEGQQDMLGFSQATKVGDTIYVAGTVGIGEGLQIPTRWPSRWNSPTVTWPKRWRTSTQPCPTLWSSGFTSPTSTRPLLRWRCARPRTGGKDLPASTMVEVCKLALPQLKFEVAVAARLSG